MQVLVYHFYSECPKGTKTVIVLINTTFTTESGQPSERRFRKLYDNNEPHKSSRKSYLFNPICRTVLNLSFPRFPISVTTFRESLSSRITRPKRSNMLSHIYVFGDACND